MPGVWSEAGAGERKEMKAIAERFEEAVRVQAEDFKRWAAAGRRRRWLPPEIALAMAVPPFLMLGVLLEQRFEVIPLHDPSGGWSALIWENYGPTSADCAWEARRLGREIECSFAVRGP